MTRPGADRPLVSRRFWLTTGLAVVAAAFAAVGFDFWRGAYDPPPEAQAKLPPPQTFAEIFTPCAHCHQIGPGARIETGPPLTGVVGRQAASFPGYPYSQAMRASGIVWDKATLSRFIANPQDVVAGTRMQFAGLPKEAIANLVDFIASISAKGGRG